MNYWMLETKQNKKKKIMNGDKRKREIGDYFDATEVHVQLGIKTYLSKS